MKISDKIFLLIIEAKIKMKMRSLGKINSISEFSISNLYGNFLENLRIKWNEKVIELFHYLTFTICLMKMGKKLMPKIKMRMKKIGKMNLIFEFCISKVGYVAIFMRIWEEKKLTHFLRYFSPIEARVKIEMKTFGKISLIYVFSISKLDYTKIFMKIW